MPQKQQVGEDKNTRRSSRRVRYQVAMSLDGFIAGPNGEADWIITDPEIDPDRQEDSPSHLHHHLAPIG